MGGRLSRGNPVELRVVAGNRSALCIGGGEPAGHICKLGDDLAAVSGHVAWKKPELAALSEREGAAAALLQGFKKYGASVLESLAGSFNASVICEQTRSVLIATDRAGIKPVAYAQIGDKLVFGPDASTVMLHPAVDRSINQQAFFDYIYFHFVPSPESVYSEIQRLLPGHCLNAHNGRTSVESYWQVEYDESARGRNFGDLQAELLELVKASVTVAASDTNVGAFLSGGVDSSTITGVLSGLTDGKPRTYSIGFDIDEYDEISFARLTADHFEAEHREYKVTPEDIIEAVPMIASSIAEPFGNASAVPAYFCAKMARDDGVDILLGGDGGDELFGGNERYAKQKLFDAYSRIPNALRKRLIEPVTLKSRIGERITPLHKIRRYVEQAAVPMPDRLQSYNFLNHFAPDQIFDASLLGEISQQHPMMMLTEYYEDVKATTTVDKMLGLDLKFTLADNDLVKVSGACDLAGVEARYPLLSDDLIEFSASLPAGLKVKGQVLRYFFKKAYKDFLPNETLRKSKHGFGLPFGEFVLDNPSLGAFVRDNLENLKVRKLIRSDFIDSLMEHHLRSHPQYFGAIVWLLLMLEQWHQVNRPK